MTVPKRGAQIQVKEDAVALVKRYYGFFALITNETGELLEKQKDI